jgi:hypothetical protein
MVMAQIEKIAGYITSALHADLFTMLMRNDDRDRTATEVLYHLYHPFLYRLYRLVLSIRYASEPFFCNPISVQSYQISVQS